MLHKGASVYEEKEFYENFMSRRQSKESPNNAMEAPVILKLIGDVRNKEILDLGCGDGTFGKELLSKGAGHYTGIDGSKNMVETAVSTTSSPQASIRLGDLENLELNQNEYDLIISRMVLHYIENLESLVKEVYAAVKPGGKFVFSVMHPVLTSTFDHFSGKEKRTHWIVDNYFESGKRVEAWMDHSVVKYHRTIEEYFSLMLSAGFTIKNVKEAAPRREFFSDEEEYKRRTRIPLMLILELTK
ncbi:class I SAM-dependent methyltransferase [Bacillus sp. P14.5]|uniref:class I SAM-dependent DNA methyltransferase n=1 Tax=Bacillus sp. P14.5 TaxID=1983400 RepID=UPI001F065D71|nr:class I SAM-dependent methyltransferase [Bacillus sp. P14.5]